MATDRELLDAYWAAQAQFGPFDIGPDEYLRNERNKMRELTDHIVAFPFDSTSIMVRYRNGLWEARVRNKEGTLEFGRNANLALTYADLIKAGKAAPFVMAFDSAFGTVKMLLEWPLELEEKGQEEKGEENFIGKARVIEVLEPLVARERWMEIKDIELCFVEFVKE